MKIWLKKCGEGLSNCYRNMMDVLMLGVIVMGTLAFVALLRDMAFWKIVAIVPEPERCALCGEGEGMEYHAPALVSLATGEVEELWVYERHPQLSSGLVPVRRMGVSTFESRSSVTIERDTANRCCRVFLPGEPELMNPAHFCHNCRGLLAETSAQGYVLVDLYDLDAIRVFAIEEGAEYTIRGYTVSVEREGGAGGLSIRVTRRKSA